MYINKLSIQLELSRKSFFKIYRRAFRNLICDNATGEDSLLISDISDSFEYISKFTSCETPYDLILTSCHNSIFT